MARVGSELGRGLAELSWLFWSGGGLVVVWGRQLSSCNISSGLRPVQIT